MLSLKSMEKARFWYAAYCLLYPLTLSAMGRDLLPCPLALSLLQPESDSFLQPLFIPMWEVCSQEAQNYLSQDL